VCILTLSNQSLCNKDQALFYYSGHINKWHLKHRSILLGVPFPTHRTPYSLYKHTMCSNRSHHSIKTLQTFNNKASTPAHNLQSQWQQTTDRSYDPRMCTEREQPYPFQSFTPGNTNVFHRRMIKTPFHKSRHSTTITALLYNRILLVKVAQHLFILPHKELRLLMISLL